MKALCFITVALCLGACQDGRNPPPAQIGQRTEAPDTRLLEENRRMAEREERDIQEWIERQGTLMEATGTGLRYKLLRDVAGDAARPGQVAVLNYAVYLLNGDTCYASLPGAPASFRIEHADVESGLHEGVQHLSVGDSAVLVIPSALAFGLLGDRDKIPMRSTLVYHIGLVAVEQ